MRGTSQFIENLVLVVREYPEIYNPHVASQCRLKKRTNAWESITQQMIAKGFECDVNTAKVRWKNVKDAYRKAKRVMATETVTKKWKYFDICEEMMGEFIDLDKLTENANANTIFDNTSENGGELSLDLEEDDPKFHLLPNDDRKICLIDTRMSTSYHGQEIGQETPMTLVSEQQTKSSLTKITFSDDTYSKFGELVAATLREKREQGKDTQSAMREISAILFR